MRISDWSSDVCSSDLHIDAVPVGIVLHVRRAAGRAAVDDCLAPCGADQHIDVEQATVDADIGLLGGDIGRRSVGSHRAVLDDARRDHSDIAAAGIDRKSTRLKLQSLMRISYAVFCLNKKNTPQTN